MGCKLCNYLGVAVQQLLQYQLNVCFEQCIDEIVQVHECGKQGKQRQHRQGNILPPVTGPLLGVFLFP